mmetsp:Transcript_3627/g.485  ORF Transcript_3627/g.485 Transcript_3627/m.485 type:complete len:119 (+) Transcript_3627:113-469(+)
MRDLLSQVKDNKAMHRPQAVPVMTREGRAAVQEAIDAVRGLEALDGLTISKGLERAAQVHVNDTGSKGIIGHIGSDESTLQDRLERYGRWSDSIAEALDYGSMNGFEVVCAFLVDDGL